MSSKSGAPRAPSDEATQAAARRAPQKGARVLLVDDDEHNLLALRTVLEDLAEVQVARSGEEALRHLLKGEFAVILLDVYMPGMDGYETAQIIRGREQTKRIPIVFLSAVNKEKEHLLRGYSMGAVDYVFKPVEPVVLRSKVAVFVDLFEMTREIQRKAAHEQKLLDANLRVNAERLRAERELRLAEQRQAAIIASLPIILYLEPADSAARVPQFVGGNFAAVTGFPFEAVAANPNLWKERLHPEDSAQVLKALTDRRHSGTMAIEYRWQCADGRYKHFLDQAVLLHPADGGPAQYAGTLLDVSDRKELEGQLLQARKMDAIGQLTGGIAHDFNNLLAAVLGGIDLIERRVPLGEDQKKILGLTRRAAEQGTELVRRLLAFARRQQLKPAAVDLVGLSVNVTELLAHTLGGLVRLEWRTREGIWPVFADSSQLELALMNLIINGRDAMPSGGEIIVTGENIRVARDHHLGLLPGDYVILAVADDGSGIPADMLEQVTEPFFTTKDVGKGTGLGLSMVYGFVRQSGGAIAIQSTVGEGTKVEIWLPRAPSEPERSDESAGAPVERQPIETRRLRILLVDDHDAVRETAAALLGDMGHAVTAAPNGPSMLELLAASPDSYDLVVTDYAMPLMSGGDMLKLAREIRPDLPGIIITGNTNDQSLETMQSEIVISKPFTACDMRQAIRCAVTPTVNVCP